MLPIDFGSWQTVCWWFRRFVRRMLFQTIHDVDLMLDRERVGRDASPSVGALDSQTVKASAAKTRGHDASKKIIGRKRHIAVDIDGRLLMVNLKTADISDNAGAPAIVDAVRKRWPWLEHLFADGAYDRTRVLGSARPDALPPISSGRRSERTDQSAHSAWHAERGCDGSLTVEGLRPRSARGLATVRHVSA